MTKPKLEKALNSMVKRLVRLARGTARADSDIDLLVVLPVTGSKRAKQVEMRVALHDIRVPKDIIVATAVNRISRTRAPHARRRKDGGEGED